MRIAIKIFTIPVDKQKRIGPVQKRFKVGGELNIFTRRIFNNLQP